MQKLSREERRKALKNKTRDNFENRESDGGKRLLSYDSIPENRRPTFFSPKGKEFYNIDIIPFLVKTDKLLRDKPGEEAYVLDIWTHRFMGPSKKDHVICLARTFNKPCPICEERDMLSKTGGDPDDISALEPKRRTIYNVIDLGSKDQKIQLWDISYFLFEKPLLAAAQISATEIITFADLEDGKTIKFQADEKSMGSGKPFVSPAGIGFRDREPYDDSILDESYSLDEMLVVPSYEEVAKIFKGIESEKNSADQSAASDAPSRKRRTPSEPEEKPAEATNSKRSRRSQASSPDNPCPTGHKFGTDCDEYPDDCDKCSKWDECVEKQDELDS